jgi:hypothetical protein
MWEISSPLNCIGSEREVLKIEESLKEPPTIQQNQNIPLFTWPLYKNKAKINVMLHALFTETRKDEGARLTTVRPIEIDDKPRSAWSPSLW